MSMLWSISPETALLRLGAAGCGNGTLPQRGGNRVIEVERLGLIACFVAVAEHGSFIAAAGAVEASASTVSRKVCRLEQLLGIRLFERTTRQVSLTEAGRIYHQKCQEIFDLVADAEATVAVLNGAPSGILRVSLPLAFGRLHVTPIMPEFLRKFPQLRLKLDFTDRCVDLIDESYDAAVRIGNLSDSSFVARRLGNTRRLLVASPSFLLRHGEPRQPRDLERFECLCLGRLAEAGTPWSFGQGDTVETARVAGMMTSNSMEALFEAALHGHGIALIGDYVCREKVRSGELVALLPSWTSLSEAAIQIIYPSRRYLPPKVQVFVDFLVDQLGRKSIPHDPAEMALRRMPPIPPAVSTPGSILHEVPAIKLLSGGA